MVEGTSKQKLQIVMLPIWLTFLCVFSKPIGRFIDRNRRKTISDTKKLLELDKTSVGNVIPYTRHVSPHSLYWSVVPFQPNRQDV